MSNLLLREINIMPLGWQTLGIHDMIGSLAYCFINQA
jgi:hypothetical protein